MKPAWLRRALQALVRSVERRSYLKRVVGSFGLMFTERVIRLTVGFAVGVWVARYLGPAEYGLLSFAAAVVGVLACMSTLSLDNLAVRNMVRNPAESHVVLGSLLGMRIVGGAAMVAIFALLLWLIDLGDPRIAPLVMLISLAQFMQAFDSIEIWYQSRANLRPPVVAKIFTLLTMATARIALILGDAPLEAFAVLILAESTLLAASLLLALRYSGHRVRSLQPDAGRVRALSQQGWPLMISGVVTAIYLRIDQVLLGKISGFEAVGSYAVAVRVVEATYIIPAVLSAAVFPAMVLSKDMGPDIFRHRTTRLFQIVFWVAMAISVPISLLSAGIVNILVGAEFSAAGRVLAVLAWMPVLTFFSVIRNRWLLAEGALFAALGVEIATCVVNVLALVLLVPTHGAVGAAWAALLGQAGGTLLAALFSISIRRSCAMYLDAALAPLHILRRTINLR